MEVWGYVSMGREIKFRTWYAKEKQMIMIDPKKWLDNGGDNYLSLETAIEWSQLYTLMQYIGLQDSKGVDIYEGDIVYLYKYYPPGPFTRVEEPTWIKQKPFEVKESRLFKGINIIYVILFEGYELAFRYRADCLEEYDVPNAYRFEVVGNVYQNPELIIVEDV